MEVIYIFILLLYLGAIYANISNIITIQNNNTFQDNYNSQGIFKN